MGFRTYARSAAAKLIADTHGRSVHIWPVHMQAAFDPANKVADRFEELLAPDERSRAARFRFDHLRKSFILARGSLRTLLSFYLGIPPQEINFTYGIHGKPAIFSGIDLQFNVSHSGEFAAFAFTLGCEVGLDIEQMRVIDDLEALADRFFSPAEGAELLALPKEQRQRAFFLCWARKEAYIKATGEGLSAALDSFRVTLAPSQPAALVHIAGSTEAAREWTLHHLEIVKGYVGALAYRQGERPVRVFSTVHPIDLLGD